MKPCKPRPRASIIVPFRDDHEWRTRLWHWLQRYWTYHLPGYEIVVGTDTGTPFSKAVAVNSAAEKASGKVFIIADADAYMDPTLVRACVDNIINAAHQGRRLWYMPYRNLYRLNVEATEYLLSTSPARPYAASHPPDPSWIDSTAQHHTYGHLHGAMMQIMPRQAFFAAGGMDDRMRGWGSEDAALMRAVDTLYAPHEVADNDILHMWHGKIGTNPKDRRWVGQLANGANSRLAQRYAHATGDRGFMQALVNEHKHPHDNSCWLQILMDWMGL